MSIIPETSIIPEVVTVKDSIFQATQYLSSNNTQSPYAEARTLLAYVQGVDLHQLAAQELAGITVRDAAGYNSALHRRALGEPVQYITGETFFLGHRLKVGPGVFIPRPETELLADWVIGHSVSASHDGAGASILDMCTGSGALAIALAANISDSNVTGVDIDSIALEYARENARGNGVQIRYVCADAISYATGANSQGASRYGLDHIPRYDIVVCNPPYLPAATQVPGDVTRDPAAALYSGPDGLDFLRAFIPAISQVLTSGGLLAVEHDQSHQEAVLALLATGGYRQIQAHKDLTNRPRFVTASKAG